MKQQHRQKIMHRVKIGLLIVFLSLDTEGGYAQILQLSLPRHSGKEVFFVATHGIRKDTIGKVLLDKTGNDNCKI